MRYGNRSSWLSPHNTAPRVRAELQASQESTRALAARYGLNVKTVAKWGSRSTTTDKPMGPAKPCSVRLSDAEETMVVDFRRRTLLPLDDLLEHLRETLPPLRIPDSVGVIDFHALERASLPKSLTCKLQEAAQLWSHSSVRGIEDVHCGIRHRVLRQQAHQCPIAQCIANQLYRL